ncbi:hypothetical protein Hdeb2414_s0006g00214081 [Helianthus debilis subsp. tardiflorus]
MENVMKALRIPVVITGVLLGSLLLYDHHQPPLELADSGGQASSSSSEVYSTEISSPACMEPSNGHDQYELLLIFPLAAVSWFIIKWLDDKLFNSEETSVLKLQVGLLGTSSTSLQSDIKRIAATSTNKGFSYVLQESTLALLRHRDYCISGYSSVSGSKVEARRREGEKQFKHLYIEERAKLNEETLVDVNDIRKKSAASESSNNDYAVIFLWQKKLIKKIYIFCAGDCAPWSPIRHH